MEFSNDAEETFSRAIEALMVLKYVHLIYISGIVINVLEQLLIL